MLWGIIGAMDREIELLRDQMILREERELCGMRYSLGTLEGHEIALACSGVGKVNAALCAATLIRELGAERLIHVGIAGAVAPGLRTLDVVISSDAVYHDMDEGVLVEYFPHRDSFVADKQLVAMARAACAPIAAAGHRVLVGRIATGDWFVGSTDYKLNLYKRLDAACVEMEGAAVAHAAYLLGVPFVIIRSMSDAAQGPPDLEYFQFKPLAADQSVTVVLGMLRSAEKESTVKEDAYGHTI